MEAGYRYVPQPDLLCVKPALCIRGLKEAHCVVNEDTGIRVVHVDMRVFDQSTPIEYRGRAYPIKRAAEQLLAITKRNVARRDITKEARKYLERIIEGDITQEEVTLPVDFLPDMTDDEEATARKLREQGKDASYIRGYILAGRKGRRSKTVEKPADSMTTNEETTTEATTDKAAPNNEETTMGTTTKGKKGKGKAAATKAGKGKRKSAAKAAPARAPRKTANGTLYSKALPIVKKELSKLDNPNDRPRGFGKAVMEKLMAELDIGKNTADQYFWRAIWNDCKDIGIKPKAQ